MPIHRAPALLLVAILAPALLAGCAGGSLSDEAYAYCVNVAPPGELDAAAEALNIAPDADRNFETNRDRGDPTFQRICEYAYNARNGDQNPAGQPGQPQEGSPSAPLDPQRSEDASSPGAGTPAVSVSPASS